MTALCGSRELDRLQATSAQRDVAGKLVWARFSMKARMPSRSSSE
jgi:hypothetical protein